MVATLVSGPKPSASSRTLTWYWSEPLFVTFVGLPGQRPGVAVVLDERELVAIGRAVGDVLDALGQDVVDDPVGDRVAAERVVEGVGDGRADRRLRELELLVDRRVVLLVDDEGRDTDFVAGAGLSVIGRRDAGLVLDRAVFRGRGRGRAGDVEAERVARSSVSLSQVTTPAARAHSPPALSSRIHDRPASVGRVSVTCTPLAWPSPSLRDRDGEPDRVADPDGVVVGDLDDGDIGAEDFRLVVVAVAAGLVVGDDARFVRDGAVCDGRGRRRAGDVEAERLTDPERGLLAGHDTAGELAQPTGVVVEAPRQTGIGRQRIA